MFTKLMTKDKQGHLVEKEGSESSISKRKKRRFLLKRICKKCRLEQKKLIRDFFEVLCLFVIPNKMSHLFLFHSTYKDLLIRTYICSNLTCSISFKHGDLAGFSQKIALDEYCSNLVLGKVIVCTRITQIIVYSQVKLAQVWSCPKPEIHVNNDVHILNLCFHPRKNT